MQTIIRLMGSTSCVKLVDGNEEKNAVIIRLMKNIAESKQQVVEAMEWAKTSVGKAEETVINSIYIHVSIIYIYMVIS